ncbi:MAG: ubiquitin-like protein [Candidatus Hodarchaeales archaeon]|jgi:hypothetical protein
MSKKGINFGYDTKGTKGGQPTAERLIKVKFKDPQLPPDKNLREKYINANGLVFHAVLKAREAFDIPATVPIALLYKGKRLNPDSTVNEYGVKESALLMIVPDQIKGGI